MADQITEIIQEAQRETLLKREEQTENLRQLPAASQRLVWEIRASIVSQLTELLPRVSNVTAPRKDASVRQFYLQSGAFKVVFRVKSSWLQGVEYAQRFPSATITAVRHLGASKRNIPIRYSVTLGKAEIDFSDLRDQIMRAARELGRASA